MKQLLILTLFIVAACTKDATGKNETHTSGSTDNSTTRAIDLKINKMCFDGTFYHVNYAVSGLIEGDRLYGGATNGIDTLSTVQLMAKDGTGQFLASTGESGCAVTIYLKVIKPSGREKINTKAGSCKPCL